jgi:outer membrane protein OmpA-like peptidoglycan-associated protein
MKLSRQRADNVKNYLIKKGIDSNRLNAEGFGPNKPLNDSKTLAERALNRRVELKLSNQ